MRFLAQGAGRTMLLLLATAALAGCGAPKPASDCGGLKASSAWVTPAHAGSREMLGYMTLHNDGTRDVVVDGVSSSQFDRALLQERQATSDTSADNTASGARPLAPFTVVAGHDYDLSPNKREIALYSPTQSYRSGDQVELTLVCGPNHATLDVAAVVRRGDEAPIDLPGADDDTRRTEKALRKGSGDAAAVSSSDDSKTAH